MKNVREKIGAELKALRLEQKKTTRQLGELADLTHTHIVRLESGRYGATIDIVSRIAEQLGAELRIVKKEE